MYIDLCHSRHHQMLMIAMTVSSRAHGSLCAILHAERDDGNENLPGAPVRLVLHGFGSGTSR
eukprot:13416458-Alexandrium_andersonii.AAC.1